MKIQGGRGRKRSRSFRREKRGPKVSKGLPMRHCSRGQEGWGGRARLSDASPLISSPFSLFLGRDTHHGRVDASSAAARI